MKAAQNHPNFISYKNHFTSEDGKFCIVME